jgi:hypothetical protein
LQEESEGRSQRKSRRGDESNGNGVAFSDCEEEAQEVECRCDFESGSCSVARSVTSALRGRQ